MGLYSKESLEALRQRIDLVEVVSSYISLHRSGASYKALCPFHEEKTPSFMIHKGDFHYHCFGCGAHGDAIAFLMGHLKMSFTEAIESLAERFQVPLERVEEPAEQGPNKGRLKLALEKACSFYHFFLLHSEEGQQALDYLYHRGIPLAFIRQFDLGYAPKQGDMIWRLLLDEGFTEEELQLSGLIHANANYKKKDFFAERIIFPIRDRMGSVIGFSARKFKEETFGGKYINTPETPLFKKSHVLFGFCYSRSKIAKERKALIVEGQVDALRLIYSGFDFTVAGQGTAFGEGHARELIQMGVNHVYLALDADKAGQEAAVKVGGLFQQKGVEVTVLALPEGSDPDSFLRSKGPEAFSELIEKGMDYLTFLYQHLSHHQDLSSPSKKNEIVETIAKRIREWEMPVMVHESLRKLADLAQIPHEMIGSGPVIPQITPKRSVLPHAVDPDRILELDLLRWLLLSVETYPKVLQIIQCNIQKEHFKISACSHLFEVYMRLHESGQKKDWLSLADHIQSEDAHKLFDELMQKKINLQKAEEGVVETVRKILVRQWMEQREKIKVLIQNSSSSEEEVFDLAKQFDALKKQPPEVVLPDG
jgi:DNA primase